MEAQAMEELCFLECCFWFSSLLYYTPQDHLPMGGIAIGSFDRLHQTAIKKKMPPQASQKGEFSQLRFSILS